MATFFYRAHDHYQIQMERDQDPVFTYRSKITDVSAPVWKISAHFFQDGCMVHGE